MEIGSAKSSLIATTGNTRRVILRLKLTFAFSFLLSVSCALSSGGRASAPGGSKNSAVEPAVSQGDNGSHEAARPPSAREGGPSPKGSIRSVDFKNFTYPWYPEGYVPPYKDRKVTLRDGEMRVDAAPGTKVENVWLTLDNVSYSDLTGDGEEEAIVTVGGVTTFNSGAACIFVYAAEGGAPKLLWSHETGDRAYGGLRSIRVEDGNLIVEQYDSKFGEKETPACCPKGFTRSYYRWDGAHFEKIKSETLPNEYENARFLGYLSAG